jgi:hypothetical protein
MFGIIPEKPFDLTEAVRNLITEDETPVDNPLAEKQQRLLVEALYESWTPPPAEPGDGHDEPSVNLPRPFWAAANVGIFRSVHLPGIAPDIFVSLDAKAPSDFQNPDFQRSYFMWEHGKAPEAVVEIVSNRKGKEMNGKRKEYARMGVLYYIVYDPFGELHTEMAGAVLHVYEPLFGKRYRRRDDFQLPELGLNLVLWEGRFEEIESTWLRWADPQGNLLLTGHERAAQAEDRAARFAAQLRALGVDPEQV